MEEPKSGGMAGKSFTGGFMGCFGILGAVLVIALVVGVLSNAGSKQKAQSVSDALKSTASPTVASGNVAATGAPFKTYQLGQAFDVSGNGLFASDSGDYSWAVTNTELHKLDSVTGGYENKTVKAANGKLLLFLLTAKNTGKAKQDLHFSVAHDLVLVTLDGTKYSASDGSDLTSIVQEDATYFTDYSSQHEVNPGAVAKDYVAFDAPDQPYKLCQKNLDTFCIQTK